MVSVLKNALDWLSRPLADSPLRNKPVAVIGGSTGIFGAVWAQAEARKVLAAIGADVLDREPPIPNIDEQFDTDGRLVDEDLIESLGETVTELLQAAGLHTRQPRSIEQAPSPC